MRKTLLCIGLTCIALALAWPLLSRIPFGRLPGDIVINRPGLRVYVPFTTMLLVSAGLSLLAWLFRK